MVIIFMLSRIALIIFRILLSSFCPPLQEIIFLLLYSYSPLSCSTLYSFQFLLSSFCSPLPDLFFLLPSSFSHLLALIFIPSSSYSPLLYLWWLFSPALCLAHIAYRVDVRALWKTKYQPHIITSLCRKWYKSIAREYFRHNSCNNMKHNSTTHL